MGLLDLFKSTKELERERKREQRAKEREVERVIDRNADRIKDLEKERLKTWEEARLQLQKGNRAGAEKLVMQWKAQGVDISRFEKQNAYAKNQLYKIQGAADLQTVGKALEGLVNIMNLSPEEFEESVAAVDEVTDDIKDMNKAMNKAYEKDQAQTMRDAETEAGSLVDDQLMATLEQEAAAGVVGEGKMAVEAPANRAAPEDINAGRDRLKKLLEEQK